MKHWMMIALMAVALSSVGCVSSQQMEALLNENKELRTSLERTNLELQDTKTQREELARTAQEARKPESDPQPAGPLTPRPIAPMSRPMPGPMGLYGTNAIVPNPYMCMVPDNPYAVHSGNAPEETHGESTDGYVEILGSSSLRKWVAFTMDGTWVFSCNHGQPQTGVARIPTPGGKTNGIGRLPVMRTPTYGQSLKMRVLSGRHTLVAFYFEQEPEILPDPYGNPRRVPVFHPVQFEPRPVERPLRPFSGERMPTLKLGANLKAFKNL